MGAEVAQDRETIGQALRLFDEVSDIDDCVPLRAQAGDEGEQRLGVAWPASTRWWLPCCWAHFGVPVCPHAGGVGLCEYVQHASIFDYRGQRGLENRSIEYVDHLHEHLVDPCVLRGGCYQVPTAAGASITMKRGSLEAHSYPGGSLWKEILGT